MSTVIVIAGAGIGGLTAALALQQRGFEVVVLESARELRPLGVGINLLPHAVRELHRLDVGDAVAAASATPSVIRFYAADGTLLFTEPRGLAAGDAYPQLSIHRGRLQMLLLAAVRERLGADTVRTGARVTGFTDDGSGVVVHTDAGDVTADVLVGADGIGSVVRAALHPGPDPLRFAGITMYRGASRMAPFLDGHTMAIVKGDKGVDLITYPIGPDLVNWVVQVPLGTPTSARWNAPASADEVLPHIADWRLGWLDTGELIGNTQQIFTYPMVDKDPLRQWGRGGVTLLGDAAHPMYPVGANGGSQAIVDAWVLAGHLASHGVGGLRRYEAERAEETAEVIAANREMHTAGQTRTAAELDRITRRYRTDTARSARA
ncbi:FAD-dependent monooxygenase [Mycolicibacterium goodii]|uniref:FAD-dependent monooxygenase n=1 Tax=Mycolicibacterium goodii TaxID=134601 RepID=UPI000C268F15|nr:FAD-dependent monooxygenase [Mycolicibacterium goodii]PJK18686.1 flavin-dependent oxidoreductase [Mycolicibacterium goodii]